MAHAFHRSFGRAFTLLALASAGVWGCGTEAGQHRPGQATEEPSEPLSHGQILAVVSTIDQGEIKNAETARQRTTNDDIRKYAERLAAEHQKTETRLQELESKLRVKQEESEMQSNLRREADRTAEQLRTVPANKFDVTYLDSQIAMHQRALTLFDAQLIPNADSTELETFLRDIRGSLAQHLAQARRLRSRFPTPPGGGI
ncbi:DUF4142 domain-containing protein [Polyangium sp. y55x31]|uniref:DUF4142 domain-containing protein n=1 Tax=Polyangium sp. y55x31 TaxID=3042688 RepID=UPI0024832E0D|nr:DUF4142 domain-containing protein [Polyangium sp. y55x31]MDI1475208.1 DUF4142 domain-containing protein [Polyangium sp. y55x31]